MRWAIEGQIARGCRPGYDAPGPGEPAGPEAVARWLDAARTLGIRSVICPLADARLAFYAGVPGGLLAAYREAGLEVAHVPAEDDPWPPPSAAQFDAVWAAVVAHGVRPPRGR